ncbi:MAG TPA: glutamate 5-kinase [Dehalococcoidia bacterium]|nr:glutamate 5-kinase [Dehalococcoidia bacterium]
MLYQRLVAKFGTNLLTGGTDHLDPEIMASLVEQVAQLHNQRHEVIIVSSGAVAAGRQKLGLTKERKDIPFKQVLASVGQNQLMHAYERLFSQHNITVAQALLTKSDLSDRAGYLNARNTLLALIELGAVCIVNENDVVATDEIGEVKFGDNDNLSAMVANLVDADLLILLTDIDGLYTADPQHDSDAKLIPKVEKIDAEIERLASKPSTPHGVGGMATKIEAAQLATSSGVTVVIANGQKPDILRQVVAGESSGTLFLPRSSKLESKKRWMLSGLASKGRLVIDGGAVLALRKQNKSLLPAGVVSVEGEFQRGDVVDIFDTEGGHIGYGIPNYNSKDATTIKGAHSEAISSILGYEYGDEVIHRNNMVLM